MSQGGRGRIVDVLAHRICLAWPRRRTAVQPWHEHIPFAMFLIDVLRPRVVVELGVHAGDSYCAFCQAVRELNLDTRCYGVDTWRGDPHAGFYDAAILDDLRAHHDPLYGSFSTLVPATFDDALPRFTDGTIDVLHIDGYHTYAAVKHDFTSWLPKMSASGVVLLHDTNVRERGFGTASFWDEIKQQYAHFEFLHGHGLGVLAVGDVPSPELAAVLDAKPDDARTIRSVFAELGRRLSLRDDVEALQRRLDDAQKDLAARARPPTEPPAPNLLQLFWNDHGTFSETASVSAALIADGQVHHCVLPLPPTARGPFRLDPGQRPAFVEIQAIELAAGQDGDGADGEVVGRWSATVHDAHLIPISGLTRLSGSTTYRFLCTDADPQLVLDGVPERQDPRPWCLRVAIRTSEDVLAVVSDEISGLLREQVRQGQELAERETELENAQARLAEQERVAQDLAARMTEQAQTFAAAQAQWGAERERLDERLAEGERERQSQVAELARGHQEIARLQTRAGEQQSALTGLQTERAQLTAQVDAAHQTARSLAAELEDRGRQLLAIERRLADLDGLLRRMTDSRGWRALNRYRALKHRVELLVRWMGSAWEALTGREYHPTLQPIEELRWRDDSGVWESTGRDPQFNVVGPWPRGWTEVALDMAPESTLTGRARLYVDRGAGWSEGVSYELGEGGGRRTRFVPLGPDVIALRFDPCESAGRFGIRALSLKRVTARHAGENEGTPPAKLISAARSRLVVDSRGGRAAGGPRVIDPYEAWLEVNEWNSRRAAWLDQRLAAISAPPLLSVVMPVYDPPPPFLDRAIASVAAQVYPHWELCIANDASTDPAVGETLRRWVEREPRIRVVHRETNGHISRATNSAAEMARGEFLVFMDHDDEITPDALGEVALYLAEHPGTDIAYSDDDKIDARGRRYAPQFKPDWSPELLLSYMYWSHLLVVRRRLFVEAGGFRVGFEGAQDYDFALRVTGVTDRVGHIPKVLYHWRALPGSTAASASAKPEGFAAGRRAVQEALDRRGVRAAARQPKWAVDAGCGIFTHAFPHEGPRVAIIVPTRNNVATLKACLASLGKTTYKNYEVIVLDDDSDGAETLAFLGQTPHTVLRIPRPAGGFNFAALNNRAVEATDADLVLFLNDDTQVIAPEWLSQMVGYLGLPGVGAVGARLRFSDGRLQHAGIVHGYYHGLAGPAFRSEPVTSHGYLSYTMVARNYSAVTAACLLTRREVFTRLGGFDAERFAVAYNDVDYCYRLGAAGYRVVYCPTAELIHREGASRGLVDDPAEPAAFRRAYGGRRDSYYNPNLSLAHERFAVDARTLAPEQLPPIRTLMCAFTLNWDGAAYSQLELTVGLQERGVIAPVVYCPDDGPLRADYEAHGIQVEIFPHPLRGVREVPAYEEAIARFAGWMDALDVDVVYGNTRQTFYAIDAAKRRGRPSIWNPRESEPWQTYFDYLGPKLAPRALQCFGYPYKVVFVADATRATCAALAGHHNFVTIHTGLNRVGFLAALDGWPRAVAREQLKVAADEMAIVCLGTVCERKGQLDLLEAVARLDAPAARTVRCFIVGDRPNEYSARLREAWHTLPADRRSRVEIVAETPQTALYYAAADVLVCASRIESFPRVILEAMAAGLPIVTTPVYGIAEQIRENVNALCYAPGDVGTLTGHISRLCRDPSLRQRLGDNSRHVLDTLDDFDAMVAAYARVFREAWLSGRSR